MNTSAKGKDKAPTATTEFFVICAGSDASADVWQFADFFAILREFTVNFGFTGTAWNLFPYDKYFRDISEKKHKDEVWFGYKHPGIRVDPAFRFRKGDPTPWKDLDKNQITNMDKKILQHIDQRNLKPGDRFNFIFIGHSFKNGDFEVGAQRLSREDLVKSLGRLSPDIQVNVMVASCWSGKLVDQMQMLGKKHQYVQSSTTTDLMSYGYGRRVASDPLRGSPFIASIINSMHGWVGEKSKSPKSLGEHIDFVRKHGVFVKEPDSIPQAYTNVDLHVAVVETLYTHYVQLKPNPPNGPTFAMVVNPGYPAPRSTYGPEYRLEPAPAAGERAFQVIQKEMSLVKYLCEHPRDYGFGTRMQVASSGDRDMDERLRNIGVMMDGLKWRFQMQERLILVWQELVNYEVLSTECIMRRIHLNATMKSDPVRILSSALGLFEYAQDFEDLARSPLGRFPEDSMRGNFEEPLYWLATLLLRCETDNVPGVFGWLRSTKQLGNIADDAEIPVTELEGIEKQDQSAYLLCPEKSVDASDNTRVGFILPHGENIKIWARKTAIRYATLRNAYIDLFGKGSWELDGDFMDALEDMTKWVPSEYETVLKSEAEERMQGMRRR